MKNKGQISLAMLTTAIFGVAVIVGIAQLVPTLTGAIVQASGNLTQLGIGGTVGSLVLSLLVGVAVGIGLAKMSGEIFGIELGL
jgi:hypothetical protein